MSEISYTTYEGTDRQEVGRPDTRTEEEWWEYWNTFIIKTEYPTFEGWIWDMLRSGVLEKGGSIK